MRRSGGMRNSAEGLAALVHGLNWSTDSGWHDGAGLRSYNYSCQYTWRKWSTNLLKHFTIHTVMLFSTSFNVLSLILGAHPCSSRCG